MQFIRLTAMGTHESTWINPQNITTLSEGDRGGTRIVFLSGNQSLVVRETPKEIVDSISADK